LLEFVAIGPKPDQRWRRPLPDGQVIRLGRAPLKGWSVPWDLRISREHVDLKRVGNRLEVHCLDTARNPVYRLGEPRREFTISAGEDFRIGGTTFRVDEVEATTSPTSAADSPASESKPAPTSDVEALKAQVAALQAQLAAQSEARRREQQQQAQPDSELEQLRAQVHALKAQMESYRRPLDEKDREIARLRVRLEAFESSPEKAVAEPTRVEETPQASRQAADDEAPQTKQSAAAPKHSVSQQARPEGSAPDPLERKSTLFVLKAQIEAQAAKMRKERGSAARDDQRDSKQSDIEALRKLLETRAQKKGRHPSGRPANSDSSLRESHIVALMALHEARATGKHTTAHTDDAEQEEPVVIEAVVEEENEGSSALAEGHTLRDRLFSALPTDVQSLVRAAAAGAEPDEYSKARIVAALNRLIVRRDFLVESELKDGLAAVHPGLAAAVNGRRFSEVEIRRAARRKISEALGGGLPAAPSPGGTAPVARLAAGQSFGAVETLAGKAHAASFVAAEEAARETPPLELARINAEALAKLRESSAAFQAACEQLCR